MIYQLLLFLLTHEWIVITASIVLVILSILLPKKIKVYLLIFYLIFILSITLLSRGSKARLVNMDLNVTINKIKLGGTAVWGLICNVLMFIPLGTLVYTIKPKLFWLVPVLSIFIETVQYFFGLGMCDIGDIVTNIIGCLWGLGIAMSLTKT